LGSGIRLTYGLLRYERPAKALPGFAPAGIPAGNALPSSGKILIVGDPGAPAARTTIL
jgi:hypothetical protein